ncbi:proline rich transmembrane protein 1B-like [Octopus bimaculoides]|uniref:proline rich transmembrane protein 1B-like n=1 Tax=Octopus bimaculoides TaxID=37653 RepID=UPI00071D037F|nr:proline rich transmembrane protein 1B-like [Octopus bimaculoides]|eukprot:XP_014790937.1 PREDICTED: uncharacterized protein LOC106884203 [Octopus bimaculoides]
MEYNNSNTEKPKNNPPGYYENPGFSATTSEQQTQPGYPPQPGYTPGYGYPSLLPVQQQPQQEQQQTVIQLNQEKQYVPNNMLTAILVTLFCFLPTGIVAIVYADKANTLVRNGDIACALEANNQAKTFIKVSIIVGIVGIVLYTTLVILRITQTTVIYY